MKELYMRSIMIQFYVLVCNCLLIWKIISQKKLFFGSKIFFFDEIYDQILPFCVWNHLFIWERLQFFVDMCRSCINVCRNSVKLYVLNKRISHYITKKLYVEIDHFPPEISDGIVTAKKIHLFAHTDSVSSKENLFSLNLCGFYYDSVSSLFLALENLFGYIIPYCIYFMPPTCFTSAWSKI